MQAQGQTLQGLAVNGVDLEEMFVANRARLSNWNVRVIWATVSKTNHGIKRQTLEQGMPFAGDMPGGGFAAKKSSKTKRANMGARTLEASRDKP